MSYDPFPAAIVGGATINMANADQTLPFASQSATIVEATGIAFTAARTLTLPTTVGQIRVVENKTTTSIFALKISPAAGVLGTTGILPGTSAIVACDSAGTWRALALGQAL